MGVVQADPAGVVVVSALAAIRRALEEYPGRNPQQLQARKVCEGVLALAATLTQQQGGEQEAENIAEDSYWAIAEHLGTPSGWSVQEHIWELTELLRESMFALGVMGANADLKHPQRDLWERINGSIKGVKWK